MILPNLCAIMVGATARAIRNTPCTLVSTRAFQCFDVGLPEHGSLLAAVVGDHLQAEAGIVEEHVNGAECLDGFGGNALTVRIATQVRDNRDQAAIAGDGLCILHGLGELREIVKSDHRHPRAGLHQRHRDFPPDAAAAAGDDHGAVDE